MFENAERRKAAQEKSSVPTPPTQAKVFYKLAKNMFMYIFTIHFSNLLIVTSQSYPASLNLAFSLMHIILIFIITKVKIEIKGFVGQLGTGQFSTGQFGTKSQKRKI